MRRVASMSFRLRVSFAISRIAPDISKFMWGAFAWKEIGYGAVRDSSIAGVDDYRGPLIAPRRVTMTYGSCIETIQGSIHLPALRACPRRSNPHDRDWQRVELSRCKTSRWIRLASCGSSKCSRTIWAMMKRVDSTAQGKVRVLFSSRSCCQIASNAFWRLRRV